MGLALGTSPCMSGTRHNYSGAALHLGHDTAMVGMAASMSDMTMPICHGGTEASASTMAGMSMAPASAWLTNGVAGLSAGVAVFAAVHGTRMLRSADRFTQLVGANHLLMSASCAAMGASMVLPHVGLDTLTSSLMATHGLASVALGAYQARQGAQADCRHSILGGLTKVAHGVCLAAAQVFPSVAMPLYLAMTAVTAGQTSLEQSSLLVSDAPPVCNKSAHQD